MEKYVVKATRDFIDGVENVKREANKSVFECTKERFDFLKANNAVELVEIITDELEVEEEAILAEEEVEKINEEETIEVVVENNNEEEATTESEEEIAEEEPKKNKKNK